MTPERLRRILTDVRTGATSVDGAIDALRRMPFEDLGFAKVDHHRALRCDLPEVVFCAGKTPEQVVAIARSLHAVGSRILATRASNEVAASVIEAFPQATHSALARIVFVPGSDAPAIAGRIAVVCAGTSDLPVAEEAAITAETMGCTVDRVADVGVAGLHRLVAAEDSLRSADCAVVVAGMEGALASVVGGLVTCPVVAVPTSVGYGASFGGLAALLAMLNSCAAGVTVVNIDNGFGAGVAAARIARGAHPEESRA